MRKALAIFAALAFAAGAHASNWAGGSGLWSSDAATGWNGTGVPNGIGAIANFGVAITGTTTQDIAGGVTVGTISLTNISNNSRSLDFFTNGVTMNQDGAGAGFATISNTNTDPGTNNLLLLSGGTMTLADDLLIRKTGAAGAIQIASAIGGTGNVTFSNASTTLSGDGSISLANSKSTFLGSILIQHGTVVFGDRSSFGNAGNVITLGQSGQGNAALLSSVANFVPNNITVASGTGGTLVLGSLSTGSGNVYTGTIALNGTVTVFEGGTGTLGLSNTISGPGGIIKVGTGRIALVGPNSYSGGTLITAGGVEADGGGALGAGNVSLTASDAFLVLFGKVTHDFIADNATLSILTGNTLFLSFIGTDVVGALIVDGVAKPPGVYSSANMSQFVGTGTITVVPEPSIYAMMFVGAGLLFAMAFFSRLRGADNTSL